MKKLLDTRDRDRRLSSPAKGPTAPAHVGGPTSHSDFRGPWSPCMMTLFMSRPTVALLLDRR